MDALVRPSYVFQQAPMLHSGPRGVRRPSVCNRCGMSDEPEKHRVQNWQNKGGQYTSPAFAARVTASRTSTRSTTWLRKPNMTFPTEVKVVGTFHVPFTEFLCESRYRRRHTECACYFCRTSNILPDGVTVARMTLNHLVQVRILVGQLFSTTL